MKLQEIQNRIYELRGQKVMLDFDLAELYQVETRVLKQAVRRNIERFPKDFMFQLNKREWKVLITICDNLPKNLKFSPSMPFAFTEQGVAMLSSVLRSKKAIKINISIMRAFVVIREFALSHKELSQKITELESKYNGQIKDVFEALNYLIQKDKQSLQQKERITIGYKQKKIR
ncbi:ORF6N domain-containing protein [Flavobacteriaceae bacterium PRS1]|nr:ORF6N domain-containing protein [Flavobacteriaceae bacterium PRS1]